MEPRPQDYVSALPDELRTDLADARVAGVGDVAEASAADVTARIRELGMVEYVEEFTPNLEVHCFSDRNYLRYSHIGIVESRAMEEAAVRRTESSAVRAGSEGDWIEIAIGRLKRALVKICERARSTARVVDVNRPHNIRHIGGGASRK